MADAGVENQNINLRTILAIGIVSVLLLTVTIGGLEAWYYYEYEREVLRKSQGELYQKAENLRLDQMERITQYRWVDEKNQIAAIPIDRAIELISEEASRETK